MTHRLIPTAGKYKIPQGFSYPLGAEIISEALASVPQYEQLSISFSTYHAFKDPEARKRIRGDGDVHILEVSYHHPYRSYFVNSHWKITVGALPSEHKHAAQEALIAILPEVHRWLSVFNPETVQYYASVRFHYNLKTGLLSRQDYLN